MAHAQDAGGVGIKSTKYIPRLTRPEAGNKYYIRKDSGGYSSACLGKCKNTGTADPQNNVLANCVGYAYGRFHEIIGDPKMSYLSPVNAENFPEFAKKCSTGTTPQLGAVIVWKKGLTLTSLDGAGHVAIVEQINNDNSIVISQSGYNSTAFWTETINKGDGNWRASWMGTAYTFRCFIYNPAVNKTTKVDPTVTTETTNTQLDEYNQRILAQQQTVLASNYNNVKGMDLLSSNNLVESPFIIAKIGEYTFGSYTKVGSIDRANSKARVTYPNYMRSISINKTNGVLNVYDIDMVYQIAPGEDPNLLDRIFSTVSGSREITLQYGDWNAAAYIKEEQAIITKVTSKVDFSNQCITYQLNCTSKALQAAAQTFPFPTTTAKGSDIIKNMLSDTKYGLEKIFPAMYIKDENGNYTFANNYINTKEDLIPGDDKVITVEAKEMDPLKYINYVVACMSSITNSDTTVIKDSTYHLIINDDINGLYFKIVKIGTSSRTITSDIVYEVDIGYPTSTLVTGFNINTDNSWAILYDYNEKVNLNHYVYSIDDNGNLSSEYVDSRAGVSNKLNKVTEINKTWWTRMTQFPITATMTIKGLLRPAILMNYIRINTYFYGQKHVSSGLYVITKQEDRIDETGYRTTLSLTRVAGDDDYTYSFNQTNITSNENNSNKQRMTGQQQ